MLLYKYFINLLSKYLLWFTKIQELFQALGEKWKEEKRKKKPPTSRNLLFWMIISGIALD